MYIKEYDNYTLNGLITDQARPTYLSGNCILFTAEMLAVVQQYGDIPNYIKTQVAFAINNECVVQSGLIRRNAQNSDQESIDDYIGLGYIASMCNKQLAKDVLNYGKCHEFVPFPKLSFFKLPYYYQNENPSNESDVRAWLGRFPALLAHLEWAYGGKPSLWKRIWWGCSVAFCSGANKDSWILSWLMIKTLPSNVWLEKPFIKLHLLRRKRIWETMKNVFSQYFTDPNHPTSVFIKD